MLIRALSSSRRRRSNSRRSRRDAVAIASVPSASARPLHVSTKKSHAASEYVPQVFTPVAHLTYDRRLHDPVDTPLTRPLAKRSTGRPATPVATPRVKPRVAPEKPIPARLFSGSGLFFANPSNVDVCLRRQKRKEVLHAIKFNGKKRLKAPTRVASSSISCKG